MDIREFGKVMLREVGDMLGGGYDIELKDIEKNNGIIRHALVIRKEEDNVAPTIYLDDIHRQYEDGAMLMMLVKNVVDTYRQCRPSRLNDMSFFMDFSRVAPKLYFKVVNFERNRNKLENIPYRKVLDLALVPLCRFISETIGDGCITIQNSHLRAWEITREELWENVFESAPKVAPLKITGLMDYMEGVMGQNMFGDVACEINIATNSSMYYGASAIFYPDMLKEMAEDYESNLFIIPSSVHETLIIPDTNMMMDVESLRSIICQVNSTTVSDEEILSDNLYLYDRESGSFFIVKNNE